MKTRDDSWFEEASCRGFEPDFFFPGLGGGEVFRPDDIVDTMLPFFSDEELEYYVEPGGWQDFRLIAKTCGACKVQDNCLDYAMSLPVAEDGFWGGVTQSDRRKLRPMLREVDPTHEWGAAVDSVVVELGDRTAVCL